MSAVASIRSRWPGLPLDGASLEWEPLSNDEMTADEATSACLLAASLDLSDDVSAAAGRPDSMITVALFGETFLAVVWRGGSDACWFRGTGK